MRGAKMELYEAIEKRRTIRKYKAPATAEQIKKITLAGTKAPSRQNIQPWEFIHVEDPEIAGQIAQAKYEMTLKVTQDNPNSEKMSAAQRDSFQNASVLAVCHHPKGDESAWLAIENICLAAVAEGLGSGIAFYAGEGKNKVESMLQLPEDYSLTCVLKIGVPGEEGYDRYDSPYGDRRPEYSWLHKNRYQA
jgi:nitroreductase